MNLFESTTELVLATRNPKKKGEMLRLISPDWEPNERLARLSILTLEDFPDVPEVVEDADTFLGNARKKAAETARFLGRWVLADDSGLAVDVLEGAPGVHSARYAGVHGDDQANNEKLLRALADIPESRRGAAFVCALRWPTPSARFALKPKPLVEASSLANRADSAASATIPSSSSSNTIALSASFPL